jgi:hypothetical protein
MDITLIEFWGQPGLTTNSFVLKISFCANNGLREHIMRTKTALGLSLLMFIQMPLYANEIPTQCPSATSIDSTKNELRIPIK